MIGFYIHVNGTPIELIEALNVTDGGLSDSKGMSTYRVEWLGGEAILKHRRSDGWEGLMKCILKEMSRIDKEAK